MSFLLKIGFDFEPYLIYLFHTGSIYPVDMRSVHRKNTKNHVRPTFVHFQPVTQPSFKWHLNGITMDYPETKVPFLLQDKQISERCDNERKTMCQDPDACKGISA